MNTEFIKKPEKSLEETMARLRGSNNEL